MNLRLGRAFGWDGVTDKLWLQSIRPMLDARELGASPRHVADVIRKDEQLACRYQKTFGAPPSPTDDQAVLTDVAKALAALVETFETPPTPFDRFRNALARGERDHALDLFRRGAARARRFSSARARAAPAIAVRTSPTASCATTAFSKLAAPGRPDPARAARSRCRRSATSS